MFGRQRSGCSTTSLALCLLLAAVSGACNTIEPRTQVMLIIDADPDVRALASQLQVDIQSRTEFDHLDGATQSEIFTFMPEPVVSWPVSIALVPRGRDASRSYRVSARLQGTDGPLAVLRAHSGFIAQRTLELHLYFSADCLRDASLDCRELETCAAGGCISARVDVQTLATFTGNAADGGLDPWTPNSASVEPVMMTGSMMGDGGAAGAGGMSEPAAAGSGDDAMMNMSVGGNCDDGQLDPDEKCDTAIPAGQPGACPTQCAVEDTCMPAQLEGAGCQTACVKYPITDLTSGDGCCPAGADNNSDNDCIAQCGNGVVETGEMCDPIDTCPNETTCVGQNSCLVGMLVEANTCNARCDMVHIEACMAGDNCCPSTCSNDTDSDCSASCGNGIVDTAAGETCESGSATPCLTTCDDGNACTVDYATGSERNCNLACTSVPITNAANGDQCCPPGAHANNDNDCPAMCGNQVTEPGERCDGRCPTAATCADVIACTNDGVTGSGCEVMCTHTLILAAASGDGCCPAGANAINDTDCPPACGNGALERGELCDGRCPTNGRACDDNNACTTNEVSGMGCQRVCVNRPIGANNAAPDGCCPGTANATTDPDCPGCGNRRIEPGEKCDPCPASCTDNDTDPCTRVELRGTGCNAECVETMLGRAPSDGCCPAGADPSNDNDCMDGPPPPDPDPVCPNGMVEKGETCDPCLCPDDGDSCTSEELTGMPCNQTCTHPPVAVGPTDGCCTVRGTDHYQDADCPSNCGNGHTEPGEDCDGSDCPSCTSTDPCVDMRRVDGKDACHPRCESAPVGANPGSPDSCCPAGNERYQDADCDARCGNGHVESGEQCDETSDTCVGCNIVTPPDPTPPETFRSSPPPRLPVK